MKRGPQFSRVYLLETLLIYFNDVVLDQNDAIYKNDASFCARTTNTCVWLYGNFAGMSSNYEDGPVFRFFQLILVANFASCVLECAMAVGATSSPMNTGFLVTFIMLSFFCYWRLSISIISFKKVLLIKKTKAWRTKKDICPHPKTNSLYESVHFTNFTNFKFTKSFLMSRMYNTYDVHFYASWALLDLFPGSYLYNLQSF